MSDAHELDRPTGMDREETHQFEIGGVRFIFGFLASPKQAYLSTRRLQSRAKAEQRAEAVRQYFIANGTLTYDEISAIGYGSEQPLASNKTPEGRAINRRIDVIIVPQLQKGK